MWIAKLAGLVHIMLVEKFRFGFFCRDLEFSLMYLQNEMN